MTHPTCPQCDSVAGCQSRARLCPNLAEPTDHRAVMQEALRVLLRYGANDFDSGKPIVAALSAAIAQPEQPTSGEYAMGYAEGFNDACAKPAQPEQQTIDAKDVEIERLREVLDHNILERAKLVHNIAQPEQTSPVRQPLTRKQLIDMLANVLDSDDETFLGFARAIEAAHGIAQPKDKP